MLTVAEHDQDGTAQQIVGIDPGRVTAWFADHVPSALPPLRFSLVAGGRSNLTYRVDDAAGNAFALRRPPTSHVLATAHDMAREYRVMTALGVTKTPVPRTFGICDDLSVNGAPFYVMEFVEGHILRSATDVEQHFDVSTRRIIGEDLSQTLAILHSVDVDEVGLGDLSRRDGYIQRQLRRWADQYRKSGVDGAAPDTFVEEVGRELARNVPAQRATTIVHGDYRLDNVIVDDKGRVRAVLDWEICTLGDPLADLGLLLVYWVEPGDSDPLLGIAATAAPGFPTRQEILESYTQVSGRDVSGVEFFMAFGYWKLACILQGVYARYVGGAGAGDRGSVAGFPQQVHQLAELAASHLRGDRR